MFFRLALQWLNGGGLPKKHFPGARLHRMPEGMQSGELCIKMY